MGSMFSVIKKMFGGIKGASNWVTADDEKLRAARARYRGDLDESETESEDELEDEQTRVVADFDVWEEIDNARTSFFFGQFLSRKIRMPRSDKLKKELEELERKKKEAEGEK
jgi:hypothetical protein